MSVHSVPLGEVCEINPSTAFDLRDDSPCTFVPMEAVDDWFAQIVKLAIRPFREVSKGYTSFAENDVLLAKITPCMENGKCAIARGLRDRVGFGSTEFHVLRASKYVLPEWLFYFWRLPETRRNAERSMTGTAGQKRVPSSHLERIKIPLPDLSEQKRFVGLLEQADWLRRTRRYAPELSDTFLPAAFLELFGDPLTNPRGWQRAKICELGEVQTGNTPPREDITNYGSAVEWIKSDNISLSELYPTRAAEMLSEKGLALGTVVDGGSVLVTCIAGSATSIGNVCLTNRRVAFNQQINSVTPNRDVLPLFLYGLLLAAKPLIQRSTTLAMKRMITKTKLEELLLVRPPETVQRQFSQLISRHDRLRARQREALRQADHLFQSLLNQVFAG